MTPTTAQPLTLRDLMHLGCVDIVRPRNAHYWALKDLVERVDYSPHGGREGAIAFARQRIVEIEAEVK